jgi:hypothetical protein
MNDAKLQNCGRAHPQPLCICLACAQARAEPHRHYRAVLTDASGGERVLGYGDSLAEACAIADQHSLNGKRAHVEKRDQRGGFWRRIED